METCLLFWLCGIAWDESIAIDKVSASDEKVDPVDCVDKSCAGISELGLVKAISGPLNPSA